VPDLVPDSSAIPRDFAPILNPHSRLQETPVTTACSLTPCSKGDNAHAPAVWRQPTDPVLVSGPESGCKTGLAWRTHHMHNLSIR